MFKVKYNPNRSVAGYKVRFVDQGYSQIPGIDFNKIFAPIVRRKSLKIFLTILALFIFLIKQIDIIEAYLKSLMGDNKLPFFLKFILGMKNFQSVRAGFLFRFLRSIYDLKQSG